MKRVIRILLIDDDPTMQLILESYLEALSEQYTYVVEHYLRPKQALARISKVSFDIAFVDLHFRSEKKLVQGFKLAQGLLRKQSNLVVIVMSSARDFGSAQQAMRAGAMDYLVKGAPQEEFNFVLSRVLEIRQLRKFKLSALELEKNRKYQIVGSHSKIKKLKKQISKIAREELPVVIEGESGTGKELIARNLFEQGRDKYLNLVSVDCGAIPDSLSHSFFFGSKKGAYTGSDADTPGIFERANEGILFLDELANLSLQQQASILRVLESGEYRKVGSNRLEHSRFRLVIATNVDLDTLLERGEIREDFYHRVNALVIRAPALRERRTDIVELINYFIEDEYIISDCILQKIQAYNWPGNIRELKNFSDALMALAGADYTLIADNYPIEFWQKFEPLDQVRMKHLKQRIRTVEQEFYFQALALVGGNVSELARSLKIDRSHLHKKLKQIGYRG